MTELEHLIDACNGLNKHLEGEWNISILNIIAELMRDCHKRRSKATYERKFNLGKLSIDIKFNGMK